MKKSILLTIIILLSYCSSKNDFEIIKDLSYDNESNTDVTNKELLKKFDSLVSKDYLLGPGDKIEIIAPGLDNLPKEISVGPEGNITIHPVGDIIIKDLNRKQAEDLIKKKLKEVFIVKSITLRVLSYENNKITILGNVDKPGLVSFDRKPTLLEAIAQSGISYGKERNKNSKCAIIRNNDSILWVDLNELLIGGNINLNVNLSNKDVLYIPGADEFNIYVMGEVKTPGAYSLGTGMNVLKAINYAGGYTEDALLSEVYLIRREKNKRKGGEVVIDLEKILNDGNFSQNYSLKSEDIIYIPRRGIAKFNYYLRMINPFAQLFVVGSVVKNATTSGN